MFRLLHTSLPEFKEKLLRAGRKNGRQVAIRGLENLRSAKMQSLRTGRIENTVDSLSQDPDADLVEVVVMPRVPETMHTVVIKSYARDGKPLKAVLEVINILHPTEEVELEGFEVTDNRPGLGRH
ncbi:MAG TPA: hypothetical protein PKJ05_07475 [Bacillota bacterium]|nr:hypothetical protein [Bacillota bacterium]HOA16157.1 hypothetical protein [Bacillota bacterium]